MLDLSEALKSHMLSNVLQADASRGILELVHVSAETISFLVFQTYHILSCLH